MNTFGTLFRFTDFGESHGAAVGGVVDGMPAGLSIDFESVDIDLSRRRPGQSALTTSRCESDRVEWLSGIYDGRTLGTPIAFLIRNNDARSSDYDTIAETFRPNHADYTYYAKYGIRDHRGGGRASARETAARVVAGALAKQVLSTLGVEVLAWTSQIGYVKYDGLPTRKDEIYASSVRCPDSAKSAEMESAIIQARKDMDTLGGIVSCRIRGVKAGVGEPIFAKLQATLASAMMSINAAKGFEYGDGFAAASMRGSECVDTFVSRNGDITTSSNHSGGIQGGISNGNDINFRVAFKPVATMPRPLETVNIRGEKEILEVRGRHDICVVPRAVAVVEAMAAMTVLDAVMIMDRRRSTL